MTAALVALRMFVSFTQAGDIASARACVVDAAGKRRVL
jgi:hypothetical protein